MNYLIFGGSCDLGKNFILEVVNNETNPFFFVSSSNEKNKKNLEIFLEENNLQEICLSKKNLVVPTVFSAILLSILS